MITALDKIIINTVVEELNKFDTSKQGIMNFRNSDKFEYFAEIILHRKAFADVEKEVGCSGYSTFHDIDKIALAATLGKEETRKFHKKFADHHIRTTQAANNISILEEKVIDYECSGRTKTDATQTAFEYISSKTEEEKVILMPVVIKFGLNNKTNNNQLTEEDYQNMVNDVTYSMIFNELLIANLYFNHLLYN